MLRIAWYRLIVDRFRRNKLLLYSFIIPLVLCATLGGLFVYKTDPSTSIFLVEYADLFFPIAIWNFLMLNSVMQSFSCLIEVYTIASLVVLYTYVRYRFPFSNYKYSIAGTLVLNSLPFVVHLS